MGDPTPGPPQALGMWLSLGHSRRRDGLMERGCLCAPLSLSTLQALQGAPGCRDPFPSCPRGSPQRPQPRGSGEPKGRSKPSRCLPALGPIPLASSLPRSDGGRRPAPPARQVEQGWGQAAGTRRALPCPIPPCQALPQHRDTRSRAPKQHCHPKRQGGEAWGLRGADPLHLWVLPTAVHAACCTAIGAYVWVEVHAGTCTGCCAAKHFQTQMLGRCTRSTEQVHKRGARCKHAQTHLHSCTLHYACMVVCRASLFWGGRGHPSNLKAAEATRWHGGPLGQGGLVGHGGPGAL